MKNITSLIKEMGTWECTGRHLLPGGMYHGENWQYLARNIGYCFADFPEKDAKKALATVYSEILVRNCFSACIPIPAEAKEFNEAVRKAEFERRNGK